MKGKRVNIKEMTQKLNEFISTNVNKTFTGKELHDALVGLGFNNGICYRITSSCFPYESIGKGRIYEMPKKPIYIGLVEGLYKSATKRVQKCRKTPKVESFDEAKEVTDAIRLLLSKGYRVQKPLGLDVTQLLKDHPELEKIYMRYSTL